MSDSDAEDMHSTDSVIDPIKGEEISLKKFFTQKELCYYAMVDRFFKERCKRSDLKLMVKIINSESNISLRILDFFATKYSKCREKINFPYGKKESFDVRISYDAQLRTYKKKNFDAFRRRKKFEYFYDSKSPNRKVLTTLGQLNFFMWAIDTKVLLYVRENYTTIYEEMKKSSIDDKVSKRKKKTTRKKKKPKSNKDIGKIGLRVQRVEDDDNAEIVLSFI